MINFNVLIGLKKKNPANRSEAWSDNAPVFTGGGGAPSSSAGLQGNPQSSPTMTFYLRGEGKDTHSFDGFLQTFLYSSFIFSIPYFPRDFPLSFWMFSF